jgi:hypothetical protein
MRVMTLPRMRMIRCFLVDLLSRDPDASFNDSCLIKESKADSSSNSRFSNSLESLLGEAKAFLGSPAQHSRTLVLAKLKKELSKLITETGYSLEKD